MLSKAFWIALLIPCSAHAIDIMMVFTPSGAREAVVKTQAPDPAYTVLQGVNDTFEAAYDKRPFTLLASYYQSAGADYSDTEQMHRELVKNGSPWARKTRFQSANAGADITIVVWGLEDNSDERFAGTSQRGSHYILIRGKHFDEDKIFAHELGHELGLPHSDNLQSIMNISADNDRQGFTEGEIDQMFWPLTYASNNAYRRARCVGLVIHEVEYR